MTRSFNNILPADISSADDATYALVRNLIRNNDHIVCCYVTKVNDDSTVNATPIVQDIKGDGTPMENVELKNIPFMRYQSGLSAIVVNPVIGDVGLLLVSDRDVSNISKAKQVPAGNTGQFNLHDSIYLGSIPHWSQHNPTEFIEMKGNGQGITVSTPGNITIKSAKSVIINADSGVTIDGDVTVNGRITASGEITGNGIPLSTHKHGGVQSGSSETQPPQS